MTDPVHQHEDAWYFYDETWSERYGPHKTEEEARKACKEYGETL